MKSVSPVLKSLRDPPDFIEDYRLEFGSLGQPLHSGVERARKQSGSKSAGLSSTPARLPSLSTPTARPPQPSNSSQQKVVYVFHL